MKSEVTWRVGAETAMTWMKVSEKTARERSVHRRCRADIVECSQEEAELHCGNYMEE